MSKRRLCILFIICIIGAGMFQSKQALAKTGRGSCGRNAYWTYDTKTKRLDLFGKGKVTGKVSIKKRMNRKQKSFEVEKLIIHEGITELGDTVLRNVISVRNISLPESFQRISRSLLEGASINSLYIPKNVSEIEEGVLFLGRYYLEKIKVSSENRSYCSVDGVLFTKDMSELIIYPGAKENSSYIVPNSVTKIAPLAFASGSHFLKSVKLPLDLKILGGGAFYCCQGLRKINISKLHRLKKITDYYNRPNLQGISSYSYKEGEEQDEYNGDYINSDSSGGLVGHLGTFQNTSLSSFKMPDNLRYIASETFRDCWNLHKFSIGKSFVGNINTGKEFTQKSVSLYYVKLHRMKVNKQNKKYKMIDNVLYTKDKKILCQVISDKRYRREFFILDKGTKEIANGAFRRISLYSHIRADHDLDRIGISAFAASKIESFAVKGSVRKMMRGAFMHSRIRSFECEKGLKSIPDNAFADCYYLEKIHIQSQVTDVGECAFYVCRHLKKVSFTNSVERVKKDAFAWCDSMGKMEFRNLEYVGVGAFYSDKLKEIIIPKSAVIDGEFNYTFHETTKIIYTPSKEVLERWGMVLRELFLPHGTKPASILKYMYLLGYCLLL